MSKQGLEPKTLEQTNSGNVGRQICAALAQHEINHLLDVVFTTLPSEAQEAMLAQLNPDTNQTIQQILSPSTPDNLPLGDPKRPASLAKLQQTWSKLWREWDDIVFAAAEEDGRYVTQELEWEPPAFDTIALAEDLEQVATRMLPILQIAFDKGFFPDTSFAQALLEAEAGVSKSMSDGMGVTEKIHLGSKLTSCVLQWEWMLNLEEEQDAYHFAKRVRQWQERFSLIMLANNAIAHFFTQLSQDDGRCIFDGLSVDREASLWQTVLESKSSNWHILYQQLIQQYSPSQVSS